MSRRSSGATCPSPLRAIGNVEAFQTVTLRSQVEGQLAEVRFKEGDEVRAGDLLFVIDTGPFEATLDQAKAEPRQDRGAGGERRRAGAAPDRALEERHRVARRIGPLAHRRRDRGGVGRRRRRRRSRTRSSSSATAPSPRRSTGGSGGSSCTQGNVVKANDTQLAMINQMKPVYVELHRPRSRTSPRSGQWSAEHPLATSVAFPSGGGEPIPGELSFIDNAVDTTTGTVLLKAVFPNADEALWPGQFVNVTLTLTTEHDAVVVPAPTVQTGQDGTYVFVVKAGRHGRLRAR